MTNVLADILKNSTDYMLSQIHISLPGIIINFNPATKLAEVQPSVNRKFLDGTVQDMPNIVNVPVIFEQTKKFSDTYPLTKGDGVLLFFCERALERWLDDGHGSEPGVRRKFDLSDAIALPGLFAKNTPKNYDPVNAIRKFHNITFKMQPDGKFEFGNDSQGLLAIMDEFMKFMKNTTYQHPMDNSQKIALDLIIAKLDQIRGSL